MSFSFFKKEWTEYMNSLVSLYHSDGILNWWSWQICSLPWKIMILFKVSWSHILIFWTEIKGNNDYKYTHFWVQRNICERMQILTGIIANSKPSFHVIISISELLNLLPGSVWVYKHKPNWNGNYLCTLIFNARIISMDVNMSFKVKQTF